MTRPDPDLDVLHAVAALGALLAVGALLDVALPALVWWVGDPEPVRGGGS